MGRTEPRLMRDQFSATCTQNSFLRKERRCLPTLFRELFFFWGRAVPVTDFQWFFACFAYRWSIFKEGSSEFQEKWHSLFENGPFLSKGLRVGGCGGVLFLDRLEAKILIFHDFFATHVLKAAFWWKIHIKSRISSLLKAFWRKVHVFFVHFQEGLDKINEESALYFGFVTFR